MVKVAIWGSGVIAATIAKELKNGVDLVGFIDNDESKHGSILNNKKIYSPQNTTILSECDYLLLALQSYAQDVYEQLTVQMGFDKNKILSLGPFWDADRLTRNYLAITSIINYNEKTDDFHLHPSNFLLHRRMEWDRHHTAERNAAHVRLLNSDYTRFRTFALCADEILKINNDGMRASSVAEVGVFRGDFASLINAKFPEKTLYLFDTFEGFDSAEYSREKDNEGVAAENVNCFRDTSVECTLKKMPYRKRCVVKKGYFPETAAGCEHETFCFVSIDVDLYESIYNSLVFFYPRLVDGGYLFVHEYNHGVYTGVKKAVERYEMENGLLRKVPLADHNGTLAITR